jgi:hypothetical protein
MLRGGKGGEDDERRKEKRKRRGRGSKESGNKHLVSGNQRDFVSRFS